MSRVQTLDCIVLKTYDVGEADRWCILFSRERGRFAARARGVRKPKSRLGGALLPLRRAEITVQESRGSLHISATQNTSNGPQGFAAVFQAQQGMAFLLRLLHDDEPLPDIFDRTEEFLRTCDGQKERLLGYTLQILHLLGILPPAEQIPRISTVGQQFARQALCNQILPLLQPKEERQLALLCRQLIDEQTSQVLSRDVFSHTS